MMDLYTQSEHDEAVSTGGLMLLVAFVPLLIALAAAVWIELVA